MKRNKVVVHLEEDVVNCISLKIKYNFEAVPWQYSGKGAWIFVSLPKGLAREIRELFWNQEAGWGRLTVEVKIGETEWKSAIWYDTKLETYLLPLKSEIRKKVAVVINESINIEIYI